MVFLPTQENDVDVFEGTRLPLFPGQPAALDCFDGFVSWSNHEKASRLENGVGLPEAFVFQRLLELDPLNSTRTRGLGRAHDGVQALYPVALTPNGILPRVVPQTAFPLI